MPHYEEIKQQERDAIAVAKSQEAQQERERQKAADSVIFDRLDRVMKNEDFNWFVATYLLPKLTEAHDDALNTTLSSENRNNNAHRHAMANELLMALQIEHERLKPRLEEE